MITYTYAQLAVGYNDKFDYYFFDRSKNFIREKNSFNSAIVHVTTDVESDDKIDNMKYYPCGDSYIKNVGEFFAFNLKYLAVKNAMENTDAEFIIYTDADFSIAEGYREEKLQKYLTYLKTENIDINSYVERYIKLNGSIMLTPRDTDWYEKYNKLNANNLEGDVRLLMESFITFRNGPKLKEFLKYWEELYHFCNENNIEHYGECIEIGVAANKAKMNFAPIKHLIPNMIMGEKMFYMHCTPVNIVDVNSRFTFF